MNRQPPSRAELAPNEESLATVRAILLADEVARLRTLEHELAEVRATALNERAAHQQHISTLEAELVALRRAQEDPNELVTRIAPVMGVAITQQIRDSRDAMIEALFPIIGSVVARAISEFSRELQRNIDAQMKSAFRHKILREWNARLHGVDPVTLAVRDALPFDVQEIFVIQRASGLLLAYTHTHTDVATDTDLISGMLTAIRDFMQVAFGQGRGEEELDEVQYGDKRIILRSGTHVYLAVVIQGVEPSGFRGQLQGLVDSLQTQFNPLLRDYDGDTGKTEQLQEALTDFSVILNPARMAENRTATATKTKEGRLWLKRALVVVIIVLLLAMALHWSMGA